MNKNTLIALLCGLILILGALTILTGQRIFLAMGMFMGALCKVWFGFSRQKDNPAPDKPAEVKTVYKNPGIVEDRGGSIFSKIDIPAILLAWATMFVANFTWYITSLLAFSPTIYYYLAEFTYAHNPFPIWWEYGLEIVTGLTGGLVIARLARQLPLTNALIIALVDTGLDLYLTRDQLLVDPIWYSITSNGLHFAFVLAGALVVIKFCPVMPAQSGQQNKQKRNLLPHFIWAVSILIILFALDVILCRNLENSPPADIVQQLEKRAVDGDPKAETKMGNIYYFGTSKDLAKAFEYYSAAAQQGDAYSQIKMGQMLLEGEGGKQDFMAAYEWLSLAQKSGTYLPVSVRLAAGKAKLSPEDIIAADKWVAEWKPVLSSFSDQTGSK
jgi:hypothetical protein